MDIEPTVTETSEARKEALRLFHEAAQDYLALAQKRTNGLPVSLRSITEAGAIVDARARALREVGP